MNSLFAEKIYQRDDVFGLSRDIPLNYVEREGVDGKFNACIRTNKHVVIYGSSKQGKTCLRKHCLATDDYIMVQCTNNLDLAGLNSSILKRAGFELTQSTTKTTSGKMKASALFKGRLIGIEISAGGEKENTGELKIVSQPMEIDLEDVNDIIAALKSINFDKIIVLEDFHYLTPESQKSFSFTLKAFHETSPYIFVIVGVWLEDNKLIIYNGDLTGRVVSVNADTWSKEELEKVISDGAALLGVSFDPNFVDQVVEGSRGSIYIVQEACRRACAKDGVNATVANNPTVGAGLAARQLIKEIVDEQSARYNAFITGLSEGFQDTELEMFKWMLYPILSENIDEISSGILYRSFRTVLREKHPRGHDLNPGNITQALNSISSLQVKKDIKPIVVDYDQTQKKLNFVDRGFLLWLAHQDINEIKEDVGINV
ncbi:hypothetical protein [Vogesella oryzae]|uniref:hypothetical protein n=1 Tax=Vogesella oryzae TaxID=1735285 RepID=UPI0015821860|nr:hypothetical protein [Vogesella oryzae]